MAMAMAMAMAMGAGAPLMANSAVLSIMAPSNV